MARGKGISLDKFAQGKMNAQFNQALNKVAANIWDPNTSARNKRVINIKVTITPDEERQMGDVDITTSYKISPVQSVKTKMVFGYDEVRKEGVANELNAEMLGQIDLDALEMETNELVEERSSKIVDLQKKID